MKRRDFVLVGCMKLAICPHLLAQETGGASPQEGAEIKIIGPQREILRPRHAGQSVVIRPSQETRFDIKNQLNKESSLILPETGRVNASGFSVPRIRGQDARFTEIYLEGLRIQDPYLGYPFIDDLDLRATGEMALYIGTPPPEFASVNPNGSIDYRLFTREGKSQSTSPQLGAVTGQPYGMALWALGRFQKEADFKGEIPGPQSSLRGGIYSRKHWTQGRYTYYDDNATPYNSADDRYLQRKHGDRTAQQVLPSIQWQRGQHQILGLGFWNQAKTSLPARLSGMNSEARESAATAVARVAYRYTSASAHSIIPKVLGVEGGLFNNAISVVDPRDSNGSGGVGSAEKTARDLDSTTAAATLQWHLSEEPLFGGSVPIDKSNRIYLRAEQSQSQVNIVSDLNTKLKVKRHLESYYAGLDGAVTDSLRLEAKGMHTLIHDRLKVINPKPRSTQATSLGILWSRESWSAYGQMGQIKRSPTLLEEFGDGAQIRENLALAPEATLHRELGLEGRLADWTVSGMGYTYVAVRMAGFRDSSRDRIILLPSVGQTLRAQNALKTEISGYEIAGEAQLGIWGIMAGYTRLYPVDRSYPERLRDLPGVPEYVTTGSLSYKFWQLIIRLSSRYQSQVWRDSENSIAIPGSTIFDSTVDFDGKKSKTFPFSIGFAVYNLTDERRLQIQAYETRANQGYTAYSDYGGMPLPGRQWRLSLSALL